MTAAAPLTIQRIAIFPLPGAVLFPGLHLPLHIFEPRYRAMVQEVLVRDRRIGMIQPRVLPGEEDREPPALYGVGCVGKIVDVEALDDGRFNLVLEGVARFRVRRELDVTTPFRQVEAEIESEAEDGAALASIERASLEREAKRFAERQGYVVDWNAVGQLDDATLVNGIAQVAPFDAAAKQALLETRSIEERAELVVQLMQFFGRFDSDDGRSTLQ
ncbi:LON peptidase substrate-binding domain-containing protein [Sphingopyxis sp. PET50]|uniref:LON peptidase substrate-binding domain-containing protein n=1 Tax=Sphingopyxis sp. PET50 TaxID=2976533 RepID=UPI0021AE8622|nr:LON peptidase substrate-binding domain-containing protein [Sphingopyxis sp. PET50]